MAKDKRKSEPATGEFRVTGVDACNRHLVTEPPTKALKYLQQRCHSREELMQRLLYYAIKHKYLGIDEFEEFDLWLRVHFVENNIEYALCLSFTEMWEIQRTYADGHIESEYTGYFMGNKDTILEWVGPEDDTSDEDDNTGEDESKEDEVPGERP